MESTTINYKGTDKAAIKKAADEIRANLCSKLNFALMNFPYKPSNEEKQKLYERIHEDIQLLHSSILYHADIIEEKEFMRLNGYVLKENV